MRIETIAVHAGHDIDSATAAVTPPIHLSTTFAREADGSYRAGFLYSRYANPTVQAVEEKLALLEGAESAMVTSSGMAATATALFGLLKSGDEVVCSAAIYGGTLQIITNLLGGFGVRPRFASLEELAAPERLIGPTTKVIWFESPINPTLRCVDLRRIANACRDRGVISVVDNTFASPVNQQPIALGIDLVMHSATKYLNGHSDVTAGALIGSRSLIDRLHSARKLFGGVLEPASAYALSRGLKTLHVRVARHNDNAHHVADWLSRDRRVTRVFYPGLASHPDHEVARKQMSGFGGMVCFEVADYAAACHVFDRLQVIQRAASLGGVESLCSLPVLTSQYGFTDDQLAAAGVTRGMIRLSVGLEHAEDLVKDLDQALG